MLFHSHCIFHVLCPAVLAVHIRLAMVYSLPHSQVKPTCFVVSYCVGNFMSAKKCQKSTFKYSLETVQGETKNNGFWQYISAPESHSTA